MRPQLVAIPGSRGQRWSVPAKSSHNRIAALGLGAVLIFGVLAYGSVDPWAALVLRLTTAALLVSWLAMQWRSGSVSIQRNPAYLPVVLFALLLGAQLLLKKTVYAYVSWTEAAGYCAYAIIFFLAAEEIGGERAESFSIVLAVFGAAVSLFAILQYASGTQDIYWFHKTPWGGPVFGPFANHNHYAGLMEMLWPFAWALAWCQSGARRALLIAGAAVMIASVFLSASRGGVLSALVQVLIAAIFLRSKFQRRAPVMIGGLAVVLAVAVSVFWLASPETLSHLLDTEGAKRLTIDRDGINMWLQRPWLGFGLGTFPIAYPHFRSFYTTLFINQAHNDYLQLLIECGIAGFMCVLAFLGLALREATRVIRRFGVQDPTGAVRLAAVLGIAGILVHSSLDYNLHIPSNAALFAALCGIASRPGVFKHVAWPNTARVMRTEEVVTATEVSAY
jgi:O-antigen ligase